MITEFFPYEDGLRITLHRHGFDTLTQLSSIFYGCLAIGPTPRKAIKCFFDLNCRTGKYRFSIKQSLSTKNQIWGNFPIERNPMVKDIPQLLVYKNKPLQKYVNKALRRPDPKPCASIKWEWWEYCGHYILSDQWEIVTGADRTDKDGNYDPYLARICFESLKTKDRFQIRRARIPAGMPLLTIPKQIKAYVWDTYMKSAVPMF